MPEPGTLPAEGQATCDDEAKQRIVRHVVADLAATRQDIRNLRLPPTQSAAELEALRLHITDVELQFLHESNIHDEDVNTPLIIARWLTYDLAMVLDRISPPTLVPMMEGNVGKMVTAYRGIDELSKHPAPWPYTHLTQIFLTFWVYSLPLCLIPLYSYATVLIMPLVTFVLFGMDAVGECSNVGVGCDCC